MLKTFAVCYKLMCGVQEKISVRKFLERIHASPINWA